MTVLAVFDHSVLTLRFPIQWFSTRYPLVFESLSNGFAIEN